MTLKLLLLRAEMPKRRIGNCTVGVLSDCNSYLEKIWDWILVRLGNRIYETMDNGRFEIQKIKEIKDFHIKKSVNPFTTIHYMILITRLNILKELCHHLHHPLYGALLANLTILTNKYTLSLQIQITVFRFRHCYQNGCFILGWN